MKSQFPHAWNVTPTEARQIQEHLRTKVRQRDAAALRNIRHVAGIDVSIRNGQAIAAIVVLDFESLEVVELSSCAEKVAFPYVPGLLSFRECPVILRAAEKLKTEPQLLLVDGQGIAHPRRLGIAAHLGLLFNKPTIGCAKTRLVGTHEEPYHEAGYFTHLFDGEDIIGGVLRTRTNVKPLYISVGHRVSLPTALDLVLECGRGFRLPEPTRLAHQAAGGNLKCEMPGHF